MNSDLQLHTINRLSYGLRPRQWDALKTQPLEQYIHDSLHPETSSESITLQRQLQALSTLRMSPVALFDQYFITRKQREQASPEELKKLQMRSRTPQREVMEGRLLRAIYSDRQLQEVMVNFWFNHFNVSIAKGLTRFWVGAYEEQAIRPHVFGNFRDLLGAVAKHPAMLFYLDNWLNTDPNSPKARGRFQGLNENYARELLELHTLGVDGGYTQADVVTLARILTGWGMDHRGRRGDSNGFYFDESRHDSGNKVLLGTPISGGGMAQVEQTLDLLATHPATAKHLSYKLAQYFLSDDPPASLVDRLAERFLNTKGEIRSVLDLLFHSSEFRDPQFYGSKFRTPDQYILALLRATEIDPPKYQRLLGMLRQLGMRVYACPNPKGYANTQQAWLSSDGMIKRVSFAMLFSILFFKQGQPIDPNLIQLSAGKLSAHTKDTILNFSSQRLKVALLLASPEMMHH